MYENEANVRYQGYRGNAFSFNLNAVCLNKYIDVAVGINRIATMCVDFNI